MSAPSGVRFRWTALANDELDAAIKASPSIASPLKSALATNGMIVRSVGYVGSTWLFGGPVVVQEIVENSARYFATPTTPGIFVSSRTNNMNTSLGTSHSHVIP